MFESFKKDLQKGKRAEVIVAALYKQLGENYLVEDISNNKDYYYKGDLRVTELSTGKALFIEVKNDERIAETQNILCEYGYYSRGKFYDGNMKNEGTDIYCVVSEPERAVYVVKYPILKEIYKLGRNMCICHEEQTTYCTLLPIETLKQHKGLLAKLYY